jgi:hypothetical protein
VTEDDLLSAVIDLARWRRWRVTHFRPCKTEKGWRTPLQGDPGWVDLALARNGVVILAELKSEKGKLGEGQPEWAAAIGAQYRLWRPSDWPLIEKELK